MDIDNLIDNVIEEPRAAEGGEDQLQELENISLNDLLLYDLDNEQIKIEIYKRFREDAINYIDSFADSPKCKDSKSDKGMFNCSHDTWAACTSEFGIDYFIKNKYLHDIRRERSEGGYRLKEDLLIIALDVYESLCELYKKVFQIYDCCRFMGINKDYMYQLSEMHTRLLKNAHTGQENSYRTGALTNRGNVTGYAMLLNHDYDYVKTSQVIHSTGADRLTADRLPTLEQPQDIVLLPEQNTEIINEDL